MEEKKRPWLCTLFTQLFLCIALYIALNLGRPPRFTYRNSYSNGGPLDTYFISVKGGYRTLEQQSRLLKKMEKVALIYKVRFVVNVGETGEDDPLSQNASRIFQSLHIPWYTTRASNSPNDGCFVKEIIITHDKVLHIVGVNTVSVQESMKSTGGFHDNQLNCLTQTLEATSGNWLVVVGYHSVVVCEENKEQIKPKQIHKSLQDIFLKYGVDAYLSTHSCINYTYQGAVAHIGVLDRTPGISHLARRSKRSSFPNINMVDGFLLHRVNHLEITTYAVTIDGEVVSRSTIQQRGREAV
ncbi:hypothetical protein K2173_017644 [Erythroxylum novogranatense]|uniref:Calcineurin-like phosphoesterase domain-containing protein n=1 Tax=Erythroxylum novogranatense TaxID=1862640 RepID=A0AAV8SMH6_9ROSI|nr:hypothetical protein K2173_017644 [Erythroxylum novogranatense]